MPYHLDYFVDIIKKDDKSLSQLKKALAELKKECKVPEGKAWTFLPDDANLAILQAIYCCPKYREPLLETPFDAAAIDPKDGETYLHFVLKKNDQSTFSLFLNSINDPEKLDKAINLRTKSNKTCMDIATEKGNHKALAQMSCQRLIIVERSLRSSLRLRFLPPPNKPSVVSAKENAAEMTKKYV
jgi:hypothetical protein